MRIRLGSEISEHEFPQIDHFGAQTAYFADCIRNGTRPEADGEEGLADVLILRAIERAAETGQPQRIEAPARPRHPTPDMVRLIPVTDRRLVF
jgi:predicted dehydrogenase